MKNHPNLEQQSIDHNTTWYKNHMFYAQDKESMRVSGMPVILHHWLSLFLHRKMRVMLLFNSLVKWCTNAAIVWRLSCNIYV